MAYARASILIILLLLQLAASTFIYRAYQVPGHSAIISSTAEELLIIAALDKGWVLNVPNYEGPTAVYVSGVQAGQATLDSVRAALSSGSITGISPNAEYQMWGYSGGSLATEWAAELQPTYAPELNFIGTAVGGLIPNVSSVLYTINEGVFAGLAATCILGLTSGYPTLKVYLDQHLIPSKAAYFQKPLTQCLTDDAEDFAFQDIFANFDVGDQILNDPLVQSVLSATAYMGFHGTPQMPVFAYKAVGDEVSPIADSDVLVKKLCSQGAIIEYVRDEVGGHVTEAITGAPDAFNFLKDRFNGVTAPASCSTRTIVSELFSAGALQVLGDTIAEAFLALLQPPLGPSSIGSI